MALKRSVVNKNARSDLFTELLNEVEKVLDLNDTGLAELLVPNVPRDGLPKKAKMKKKDPRRTKISMFNNWKTGGSVGKNAVKQFIETVASAFILGSYKIIAELEPICVSKKTKKFSSKEMDFFDTKEDIKSHLEKEKGIYIFYDSMGRAIYAGKTEKNSLWQEMKSAYNRERKTQQKFKRTTGTKIYKRSYYLHEVAAYVSVYSVKSYAISFIEALLIHSFPNDLTNVRVEKNGKIKFEADSSKRKRGG